MTPLDFELLGADGGARLGRMANGRAHVDTPCFMPVGTRAAVRTLSSADLEELDAKVVLANTYHLMLRPGSELVAELGGLHRFMGWDRLILTDSGGYQVFSLEPKVTDDGATFQSTYDGSYHQLTPEGAVDVQLDLGSDIQMVLDVCPPLPSPADVVRAAVDRTALWAGRARHHFLTRIASLPDEDPRRVAGIAQFGIVQGGVDIALRLESAARTLEVGFDGYAVGGLSVGEQRAEWLDPLEATAAVLPADRPRYFMGLGDPAGLVEAVARGIDLFDCVLPTRLARHGTLLTNDGRVNIGAARYARSDEPVDATFAASPANRWSRGYIRHLLQVGEPSGARLCTLHNVAWILDFMQRLRAAIGAGTFEEFRRDTLAVWA
ncbi:MAG: tRNA guanosine(34) transglycosylase Tgt [Acidimicrobiales bacterium]|nr:tRNA guanosine(34) transglycosylase Tgt [Acidimicrobiales bacterium]